MPVRSRTARVCRQAVSSVHGAELVFARFCGDSSQRRERARTVTRVQSLAIGLLAPSCDGSASRTRRSARNAFEVQGGDVAGARCRTLTLTGILDARTRKQDFGPLRY